MYSGPIGIQDSNTAKLVAIKTALEIFVQTEWKNSCNLIIESDSIIAVKWCIKEESRLRRPWDIFSQINSWLAEIEGVRFVNIFREANSLVDHLAKARI
ncbi:hypothetical protein REPUB_Repub11eG0190200 [Reevesia pubescens]